MSSRSDRSKHRYSGTSEFLAHIQLDDDPRAPIQQSVEEEFRQHDGVVMILMCYRRRASPKHCNDMIEVEFGGRGHRTRLRKDLNDQLFVSGVPPAPVYKGAKGEGLAGQAWRARESYSLWELDFPPPNPSWTRILQGGERERGRPPLLVLIGLGEGGRRAAHEGSPLTSPPRPMLAHYAPGGFR